MVIEHVFSDSNCLPMFQELTREPNLFKLSNIPGFFFLGKSHGKARSPY